MLTPKILPWLAKKAHLPKARAQEIWREVMRDADQRFQGDAPAPAYWRFVSEELQHRIRREGACRALGHHRHARRAGVWVPARCFIPYPLLFASAAALGWASMARAATLAPVRFWRQSGRAR